MLILDGAEGAYDGRKDLRLPVTRRHIAKEIRLEGREDSCLHADTRRAIFSRTAHGAIVLSLYGKLVLIGILADGTSWLEMGHQMHLFFGYSFSFRLLLCNVIPVLVIQVDLHGILPNSGFSVGPNKLRFTYNCNNSVTMFANLVNHNLLESEFNTLDFYGALGVVDLNSRFDCFHRFEYVLVEL